MSNDLDEILKNYECEGQIDIWEWMEEKETQNMTREELIRYGKDYLNDLENAYCEISDKHMEFVRQSIKALSAEPCCNCIEFKRYAKEMGFEIEQEPVLDKIRAEIEQKIEQERFARSVFRGEEKDAVKAEQCTGSIFAYNNVIELINKHKEE